MTDFIVSRLSKLRKAARGQPCQVMLPDVCISGGENPTTVLAHLPSFNNGGGMGMKAPDLLGAHACHACHDVVDNRVPHNFDRDFVRTRFLEGMRRTIVKLYADNVLPDDWK